MNRFQQPLPVLQAAGLCQVTDQEQLVILLQLNTRADGPRTLPDSQCKPKTLSYLTEPFCVHIHPGHTQAFTLCQFVRSPVYMETAPGNY